MSLFMHRYLIVVLVILGLLVLASLLYLVLGKRFTDKIVATNLMGSLGVNLIVILAVVLGADYILDISLVFALLAVAAVLLVSAARRERRRRVAARRRAAKRRQAARRSAGGTTSRTARSYSTRSDARRRSAQQDYRRRR